MVGYSRFLARIRIGEQALKPFFGQPYLTYGQCIPLWSYFFQLGGLLGGKHVSNLDSFGPAFLGVRGPSGAVKAYFSKVAEHESRFHPESFSDWVMDEFAGRIKYIRHSEKSLIEKAREKLRPKTVEDQAWQYCETGAALGAIQPMVFRRMLITFYTLLPKVAWARAHSAGIKIPPKQDMINYEELEENEDAAFMEYCKRVCPDHFSILKTSSIV